MATWDEKWNNLSERERAQTIKFAMGVRSWKWLLLRLSGLFLAFIILLMGGCPQYNVWQQGLQGKAELARAEQNRQIKIEEAQAALESASRYADAEIERARGVDEANSIIAGGLGGAEGYLRYLYINALEATNCQTIYIPTEAGLPILEATRGRIQEP